MRVDRYEGDVILILFGVSNDLITISMRNKCILHEFGMVSLPNEMSDSLKFFLLEGKVE